MSKWVCRALLLCIAWLVSCRQPARWEYEREIQLDTLNPLGLAVWEGGIWFSDPDHNRLVKIDLQGKVLAQHTGIQRPMHISSDSTGLYIPEFEQDAIQRMRAHTLEALPLLHQPDAPAAVVHHRDTLYSADFYHHHIVIQAGSKDCILLGKEGHTAGEFYYPTDLAIYENKLYVADAYNKRVQIFDSRGQYLGVLAEQDSLQVAIGLAVDRNGLYVCDFENNRVLIYDLEGKLLQSLTHRISKPTDAIIYQDKLFIANYGSHSIAVYRATP